MDCDWDKNIRIGKIVMNARPPQSAEAPADIVPWLDILAAPGGDEDLLVCDAGLRTDRSGATFPISPHGIPLFALSALSEEADYQQQHYDRIANAYIANLSYPHTQEYMAYLDRVLMAKIGSTSLGTVAELCCGHGEALKLSGLAFERYVGIDVSEKMLESGLTAAGDCQALFVQGDATRVPLKDASVDTVLMLGGVHHVPDRAALFREVRRILRPGGRFVFREPVSDFVLWKAIRWLVYRLSPMLDHATERPLTHSETAGVLTRAGLDLTDYRTCGFLGFCLFMNSDVLIFNRLFRYVPGIRALTRGSTVIDEAILRMPGFGRAGLQVVGEAKPVACG